MAEGNKFIALALMVHLFKSLISIFPKNMGTQKMGKKLIHNQVRFPKGLDADRYHQRQVTNQINCGSNAVQMTGVSGQAEEVD